MICPQLQFIQRAATAETQRRRQFQGQCFVCGVFTECEDVDGFNCCLPCVKNGGELVITSEYGEGMGVMEAAYLEI
jgi:hypothetical protein